MYNEKIVDIETGKEIIKPLSEEIVAEIEQYKINALQRQKEQEKINQIRQSAIAKLAALGLTEDEIAAL